MKRFAGWTLASPATLLVLLGLVAPVAATIYTTFGTPGGPFAPYMAFFGSGFRRTVLLRTHKCLAGRHRRSRLVLGFITAYVVARAPDWLKSILIIAAVFPLLTGVVVRSFAWLIILGKNGILNSMSSSISAITDEPFSDALHAGLRDRRDGLSVHVPLMILTLVGVLEAIPDDVIQASASLGASPSATFTQVDLAARRARPHRRRRAGLHRQLHLIRDARSFSVASRQMMMGTLDLPAAPWSPFDWVERVHHRRDHGRDHRRHGASP
jgi:putative spermidine/putrescine transport system permease protein